MRGPDVLVPDPEVALDVAAGGYECVVAPGARVLADLRLRGADHRRVVAAAQSTIGADDDESDRADLGAGQEQWMIAAATLLQVARDIGDPIGIGNGCRHPRLRLHDATGRD